MKEIKELSIKTVPVEIRVITVDGKRMTKSVFDQIAIGEGLVFKLIDGEFVECANVLGWVKSSRVDNKVLLYSQNNSLYKCYNLAKSFSQANFLCEELSPWEVVRKIEKVDKFKMINWDNKLPQVNQTISRDSIKYCSVMPVEAQKEIATELLYWLDVFERSKKMYLDLLPKWENVKPDFERLYSDENQIFISI